MSVPDDLCRHSLAFPPFGPTHVYAATHPDLAFKPGVHVNYAEMVMRMKDGLPTLKNLPAGPLFLPGHNEARRDRIARPARQVAIADQDAVEPSR
jgi:hypothetical protein